MHKNVQAYLLLKPYTPLGLFQNEFVILLGGQLSLSELGPLGTHLGGLWVGANGGGGVGRQM